MKKLLYVSFENGENQFSGVNKKIEGQIRAFEEAGFCADRIARYGDGIAFFPDGAAPQIMKTRTLWRIALCRWAARHAGAYDAAYIRFQFFCPFVLGMVRAFHGAGVKTVMEIPTYPYVAELKKQGARAIHKRVIDGCFKTACAGYIDRFAAPLYGKPILGKDCIEIRNGIDVDQVRPRQHRRDGNAIHLLAVAMMAPWHGYDRLISGIHEYYARGGARDVRLHLVGEGAATPYYTELIRQYGLSDHVIQYGRLFGADLDAMYDMADIGVGSLASTRKEIYRTNTLKVLEYMAKGLPVICEEGEMGIPAGSPFRLTIPADESPVDVQAVVAFHDAVYAAGAETVIRSVRGYCAEHCSPEKGLRDVLTYLEEQIEGTDGKAVGIKKGHNS